MALNTRNTHISNPFVLGGNPASIQAGVIAQDGARTAILAQYTVMAQKPEDGQWVPYTDITATDGTELPTGIYLGDDIAAASLVAGNIENAQILVGNGCIVNESLIVLENAVTLTNEIESRDKTVRAVLREVGIHLQLGNEVS